MAMSKTAISVAVTSGNTSGNNATSQITGELKAIVFELPADAPVGAWYRIYQLSPEITLLEVSGQQIAERTDKLFCPRHLADTKDGQTIGAGGVPFPTAIPLYSQVKMEVSDAVEGSYIAHLFYN
jgi:hypothetical protein